MYPNHYIKCDVSEATFPLLPIFEEVGNLFANDDVYKHSTSSLLSSDGYWVYHPLAANKYVEHLLVLLKRPFSYFTSINTRLSTILGGPCLRPLDPRISKTDSSIISARSRIFSAHSPSQSSRRHVLGVGDTVAP